MKNSELKEKTKIDMEQMLDEKRRTLATLQFDLASGKVKNIKDLRLVKRDIARLMTALRQLELQN